MTAPALPAGMHVFERGWLSSNNVLFTGAENVLVDSGYVTHGAQTLALVRRALGPRQLDRILNTHLHSDHCGGNALLQAECGAAVHVPAADLARVRAWDEEALSFRATGQQCPRFTADGAVEPGQELELGGMRWQALAAPGHEPHALIYWCAHEGIVISADALWENGFGVVFPELLGEPGFDAARATLELIGSLHARVAIPGHGRVFGAVDAAVKRALARVDFLAADPVRNAQNAVKVVLKFLLLERQRIPLAEVEHMFATVPMFVLPNERFFHQTPAELADWVVWALRRAGVARVEDGVLINRDF